MGLCVNPFYDNELSSYHDDTVVTWDLRHLTKPTASIQVSANVSKVQWIKQAEQDHPPKR